MRLIKIDQSRVWLVFFLLGFFSHIAVGQSYTGTYYVNGNFVLGDGQVIQNGSNYYSEFYVDDTNEVLTVDGGVLNGTAPICIYGKHVLCYRNEQRLDRSGARTINEMLVRYNQQRDNEGFALIDMLVNIHLR